MPLVSTSLKSDLAAVFKESGFPASPEAAGTAWAKCYRQYASAATAGATVPLPPTLLAAEATLATALGAAFSAAKKAGDGALPALTNALDTAFVAFWQKPPVMSGFLGPAVTGAVSVVPPSVLGSQLASAFDAGLDGAAADDQASSIANAVDSWTKTVMVMNTTAAGVSTTVPLS